MPGTAGCTPVPGGGWSDSGGRERSAKRSRCWEPAVAPGDADAGARPSRSQSPATPLPPPLPLVPAASRLTTAPSGRGASSASPWRWPSRTRLSACLSCCSGGGCLGGSRWCWSRGSWAMWMGGGAPVTPKGVAPCAARTRFRFGAGTIRFAGGSCHPPGQPGPARTPIPSSSSSLPGLIAAETCDLRGRLWRCAWEAVQTTRRERGAVVLLLLGKRERGIEEVARGEGAVAAWHGAGVQWRGYY
jgi:hypothetical protein